MRSSTFMASSGGGELGLSLVQSLIIQKGLGVETSLYAKNATDIVRCYNPTIRDPMAESGHAG